jgi:menaquinone-9 beta-reductase
MKTAQVDALVVGGGPAGLSAAIHLVRQGAQVLLCEARHYPHDKMCGEFLSPECAGLLGELGMHKSLSVLQPAAIHSARLTAPDGSQWQVRLPGTALGLSRRVLDAAMADCARQAGVQIWEGTTVQSIQGSLESGFSAQVRGAQDCEYHARLVIGAHGKRAALDRALDRQFMQVRQPYLALKAHFDGPPLPGRIELHGFPGGYCGLSEIEGGHKVAALLVHERVFHQAGGGAGNPVDTFIAWMQSQNPNLRAWFSHAHRLHARWISISQVCFDSKPAIEQDVLLAGDAAGLIAPLAGNGIAMALEGGRLAAGLAGAFLAGSLPAQELRRQYPASWRRAFGQRLALGRTLQPLMLRPAALSLTLRLLRRLPPLGRYLVDHTRTSVRRSV